MKRYIDYLIRSEEHRVDEMLFLQIKDKNDLCYGLMRGDVIEAKPTIYMMATALALYLNSRSRYYKSEKLMEALQLAADGVARVQRKSGYIDYPCCNFFSAPDTSFCYKRLNDGYRLMKKYQDVADTTILQKKYLAIMRMAAEAIRDGGFHTPNHRWGICAALMQPNCLLMILSLQRALWTVLFYTFRKALTAIQRVSMQSVPPEIIMLLSTMQ